MTDQQKRKKSIDEIRAVKRRREQELLKISGVTGIDIGRKQPDNSTDSVLVIRVFVQKADEAVTRQIPEEIEGVPIEVIEREFRLHSS